MGTGGGVGEGASGLGGSAGCGGCGAGSGTMRVDMRMGRSTGCRFVQRNVVDAGRLPRNGDAEIENANVILWVGQQARLLVVSVALKMGERTINLGA